MRSQPALIEIPDPSLILLIGSSGAGKSTFAARHFKPTEVISSDRCRAMISDDESDQTINDKTFALLHHIANLRLSVGKLTVIDATNLEFRARRPLLRMARKYRRPVCAMLFEIPIERCLENNRLRPERKVPEHVIVQHEREQAAAIQRLDREGYDRIWRFDEAGVRSAVIRRV
jgi:protein phosphatase